MTYQTRESRKLYRSRNGVIFGVCRGVAEYMGFDVFWTRVAALAVLFFVWPVLGWVYVLAALLMKPEPVIPLTSEEDSEFYDSYTRSRTMALHRLKRTFDALDRRIQRMESIVTARDYDWDRRLSE
ncbi:MAG: PspC domain-containing protein [Candidatus Hydrogenedentes bacterium]|nr:PspC domain-containing protein [Candidatus Hydrogenedentota bacterium]